VRPRGRIDSLTAAVGDMAGALRRRREGREPYVRLYDEAGRPRAVDPASPLGEALLDAAAAMVDAAEASSRRRDGRG
jgi:hypothetical protein